MQGWLTSKHYPTAFNYQDDTKDSKSYPEDSNIGIIVVPIPIKGKPGNNDSEWYQCDAYQHLMQWYAVNKKCPIQCTE